MTFNDGIIFVCAMAFAMLIAAYFLSHPKEK